MDSGGALKLALAALRELRGYFVWPGDDGREYVLISRQDFDNRVNHTREEQLGLLTRVGERGELIQSWTADDMLEKINRDLALYQLQREEELQQEETEEAINESSGLRPLPPKRVRFEPLRGDLPPDLQE